MSFVVAVLILAAQEDPAKLLDQLRSESVELREAAARKLADAGRAVLPLLEKAAKDPDSEVVERVVRIRRVIELRATLSPALRKKFPGIEERLDADPHVATLVFMDLPDRERDGLEDAEDPFPRSDFQQLAAAAVRGARGTEIEQVCFRIYERTLVEAAPELVRFLTSPDPELRGMAALYLGDFGHRAAIPGIVKLMEDSWGNNRPLAAGALHRLDAREAIPALRALLKSKDEDVRSEVAELLGVLGAREAIPDLLALCRDAKEPDWGLLDGLVALGAPEVVPLLLVRAASKEDNERELALVRLVKIRSKEAVPFLRAQLIGGRGTVDVLQGLGEIGDPAAIPDVKQFLGHSDPVLAGEGMVALAGMGWKEHLPDVLRELTSDNSNRRWYAARALGATRSTEYAPRLMPLLGDRDVELRWAAIEGLEKMGAKDALPKLKELLKSKLKGDRDRAEKAIRSIEARKP